MTILAATSPVLFTGCRVLSVVRANRTFQMLLYFLSMFIVYRQLQRLLTFGAWLDFRGSANLDGGKNTVLFSVTSDWKLAFYSIMGVGAKLCYAIK